MLWIYERNNQTLRVETRFDAVNKEYLLIIRSLDGTDQVERFPDAPSFQARITSLERQLEAEHWATQSAVEEIARKTQGLGIGIGPGPGLKEEFIQRIAGRPVERDGSLHPVQGVASLSQTNSPGHVV